MCKKVVKIVTTCSKVLVLMFGLYSDCSNILPNIGLHPDQSQHSDSLLELPYVHMVAQFVVSRKVVSLTVVQQDSRYHFYF